MIAKRSQSASRRKLFSAAWEPPKHTAGGRAQSTALARAVRRQSSPPRRDYKMTQELQDKSTECSCAELRNGKKKETVSRGAFAERRRDRRSADGQSPIKNKIGSAVKKNEVSAERESSPGLAPPESLPMSNPKGLPPLSCQEIKASSMEEQFSKTTQPSEEQNLIGITKIDRG